MIDEPWNVPEPQFAPLPDMPRLLTNTLILVSVIAVFPHSGHAQSLPTPLTEDQAAEVGDAVTAMKRDSRGPYLRLRWFCADGSVQPPAGTPCAERGGGVQYAELSDLARRLATLKVHVGTILQSLSFDEFLDEEYDNYRLRELVLADYLFQVDDGWALRRARYYRGARQIEDEERQGQAFLERLLSDKRWLSRNYFLATQVVETVPHPSVADETSTTKIRNLSTEIATLDSAFFNLRIRIHSFPSQEDLTAVQSYLDAGRFPAEARPKLVLLLDELRRLYNRRHGVEALASYERRLAPPLRSKLADLRSLYERRDDARALAHIASLAPEVRRLVEETPSGKTSLLLVDLSQTLHDQAFVIAGALESQRRTPIARRERLSFLSQYFAVAYSIGFLSGRERMALEAEIARLRDGRELAASDYRAGIGYLSRALDWSVGTGRSAFGPVVSRYAQFEPKASGLYDAQIRASILLPLSLELGRLSADADGVIGTSHDIFGEQVSSGVRGLNPGVAHRTLEIVDPAASDWQLESTKIYVIPETTPELRPPAGLLTLDAGNPLSHVQLLARNLGIPNASVASAHIVKLQRHRGDVVFYAVSPMGRVILKEASRMTALDSALIEQGREAKTAKFRLDTSRLRLDQVQPIALRRLRATDSGIVVGPKAANLGELAAYFPDYVSVGLALPFGMFYRHANRPFDSDRTVLEELEAAYGAAEAMRSEGRSEDEIDRFMFAELERVRRAILELEWRPEMRDAIVRAIRSTFSDDLGSGVFVRSDTNVEDLPQFSGAGLNLTVPHQRTLEAVLASIKRVWTSPFTERAYLWRKQLLEEQGRIFPSVLLLESVHSDKSGVLITSGLQHGPTYDLTIATAEGVGGAVEGEDAETILVRGDGTVRLLSQAKATARRALVDSGDGGVRMAPTLRPEHLLSDDEVRQLRDVVGEWKRRFPGAAEPGRIWDIEFGFADGKLWLFQIRPFIRFRSSQLLERLGALDARTLESGRRPISLEDAI